MTKILALLLSVLAPASIRTAVDAAVRGSTRLARHVKPVAVALAHLLVRVTPHVIQARRDVALVLRSILAQRYDRRIAGSDALASFAVAEAPRIMPAAVRRAASELVDSVEVRFVDRFPAPGQARVAAGLFTSAVALVCAGVVGVVSFVDPQSAARLPQHAIAQRAGAALLEAAAAPVSTPSTPAADPGATATEPPAEAAAAATPTPASTSAVLPGERGALPIGKGMWIWQHDRAEGGDVHAIVEKAKTWGFTHLYVRTGTLREGFMAGPFLDRLLPVAHANGIRVYGWDFPFMYDPGADVNRAVAAIRHTTPDGHRIDGFAPDIETRHEGTNENLEAINAYVTWLRDNVGPDYPLIAVIPNPTAGRIARGYPFAEIIRPFDAVAPMVYWMNRDPGADVAHAITFLAQFGKPVFPIGQAYDGAIDGGPAGIPDRGALIRFLQTADQLGAVSVSFWSWQHASPDAWNAISDAMEFRLGHGPPEALRPAMLLAYQLQLAWLGHATPTNGVWTAETAAAVVSLQRAAGLPETGIIDLATRAELLRPRIPTVRPAGH